MNSLVFVVVAAIAWCGIAVVIALAFGWLVNNNKEHN